MTGDRNGMTCDGKDAVRWCADDVNGDSKAVKGMVDILEWMGGWMECVLRCGGGGGGYKGREYGGERCLLREKSLL